MRFWMKFIILIVFLMLISMMISCVEATHEELETPSAKPETATPAVTEPSTTDEPLVNPYDAHQMLHQEMMKHRYTFIIDRESFLSAENADKISIECKLNEAEELLGKPHYRVKSQLSYPQYYGWMYIYVLDDGTVMELGFSDTAVVKNIYKGSVEDYIQYIAENWDADWVVPTDPVETYETLYSELTTHEYMHLSERSDYPSAQDAKKILETSSIADMKVRLGEPHFTQSEETHRYGSSSPRMEYHFYILSDGTVMFVVGGFGNPNVSDVSFFNAESILKVIENYLYF